MSKLLIINADDFGLDDHAVDGILELAERNYITSTSILANMVSAGDLNKLKKMGHISKGLHINLTEGKPLSNKSQVDTMIDNEGKFLPINKLLIKFILGRVNIEQIERELLNQMDLLKNNGLEISHADSHKHIHQFPFIGPVILRYLKKHGIKKIRNCRVTDISIIKTKAYRMTHQLISKANKNFITPDTLITSFLNTSVHYNKVFQQSVELAFGNNDTVELMTHPAIKNNSINYLNREGEYSFWKSGKWTELLKNMQIHLIRYDEL
ncbi:MAG: ChbG/HpnK family deacetylase [Bacteroidetes bacterium]|nr:ChbG/HpnK family deacetylase [Bacteroidota bacterium]